jgi:hypothetical protein
MVTWVSGHGGSGCQLVRVPRALPPRLPGPPGGDECQIVARAAPLAGWPSSQPVADRGNATAVYTGAGPAGKMRAAGGWLDWAWLDWA